MEKLVESESRFDVVPIVDVFAMNIVIGKYFDTKNCKFRSPLNYFSRNGVRFPVGRK